MSFVCIVVIAYEIFGFVSPTVSFSLWEKYACIQLDITQQKWSSSLANWLVLTNKILNVYKWKSLQKRYKSNFFMFYFLAHRKKPSKQIVMAATKHKKKYTNISGSQWNVCVCYKNLGAAKRNSEWFFSWSLAWNGNGFVRKLQLKKKFYMAVFVCGLL